MSWRARGGRIIAPPAELRTYDDYDDAYAAPKARGGRQSQQSYGGQRLNVPPLSFRQQHPPYEDAGQVYGGPQGPTYGNQGWDEPRSYRAPYATNRQRQVYEPQRQQPEAPQRGAVTERGTRWSAGPAAPVGRYTTGGSGCPIRPPSTGRFDSNAINSRDRSRSRVSSSSGGAGSGGGASGGGSGSGNGSGGGRHPSAGRPTSGVGNGVIRRAGSFGSSGGGGSGGGSGSCGARHPTGGSCGVRHPGNASNSSGGRPPIGAGSAAGLPRVAGATASSSGASGASASSRLRAPYIATVATAAELPGPSNDHTGADLLPSNPDFITPSFPQPPRTRTDSCNTWALMVEAGSQTLEAVVGPFLEGSLMELFRKFWERELFNLELSLPPFTAATCVELVGRCKQLHERLPITIHKRVEAVGKATAALASNPLSLEPEDVTTAHLAMKGMLQDCIKAMKMPSLLGAGSRQFQAFITELLPHAESTVLYYDMLIADCTEAAAARQQMRDAAAAAAAAGAGAGLSPGILRVDVSALAQPAAASP